MFNYYSRYVRVSCVYPVRVLNKWLEFVYDQNLLLPIKIKVIQLKIVSWKKRLSCERMNTLKIVSSIHKTEEIKENQLSNWCAAQKDYRGQQNKKVENGRETTIKMNTLLSSIYIFKYNQKSVRVFLLFNKFGNLKILKIVSIH